MKAIFLVVFTLSFAMSQTFAITKSNSFKDYTFQSEKMLVGADAIYLLSPFDTSDRITAYTYNGLELWDAPLPTRLISWQVAGSHLFIFSKSRNEAKTHLTCLDRFTGNLLWQTP